MEYPTNYNRTRFRTPPNQLIHWTFFHAAEEFVAHWQRAARRRLGIMHAFGIAHRSPRSHFMMRLTRRAAQALIGIATLVSIAACTTSNYREWTPQGWNPPAGMSLPIAARVAVEPDPGMPQVQMRSAWWSYPDAQLMQQAALNVFQKLFSDAGPAATVEGPAITIVLKGDSSLNPTLNEYYANATATVFAGADTHAMPIATFNGNGKASQSNYSRSGIREAYEAAFAQIANDLLADKPLLARLRAKTRT
ncbi:MAG: hypothetical protein JNK68_01235 [Betaproteobacteria bacterium]|nr:hypothetical protein [Betaproteobacteria bacterium]